MTNFGFLTAAMEAFFASLNKEHVHPRNYRTGDDAGACLCAYLEHFYNPRRQHRTIERLCPVEYENATDSA